jgi:membrane protein required for colicin V production
MQAFDIIAGLLLLISAISGLVRGAVREVVGVVSFIAAAVLSLFALRFTGPVFRGFIDPAWMGTTLAVVAVFGLTYLVLRLLGAGMTRRVQDHGAFGALDRSIGAGFGLIRALVLLGMFNLLFSLVSGGGGPTWVRQARLFPLTEASGKVLKLFAPKAGDLGGRIVPAVRKMVTEGATSDPKEGYSARDRRSLDDLVERAR